MATRVHRTLVLVRDGSLALATIAAFAVAKINIVLCRLCWQTFKLQRNSHINTSCNTNAVSIIVESHAEEDQINQCLHPAIDAATFDGVQYEIIVIGPKPAQYDLRFVTNKDKIRYLDLASLDVKEPWREAASLASNDVIVLIRNDVRFANGSLRPLLDCFKDASVFAATCLSRTEVGSKVVSFGRTRGEIRQGEIHLWQAPVASTIDSYEPVLWASRIASAFHRARFLELGGFNPLFKDVEIADAELCFRAWQRGWRVVLQPKSSVQAPYLKRGTNLHPDIAMRDKILFNWSCFKTAKGLLQYQLYLAFALLKTVQAKQLNLRPFRYALCALPRFLAHDLAHAVTSSLSEQEIIKASSHQLLLHGSSDVTTGRGSKLDTFPGTSQVQTRLNSTPKRLMRILLVFPQLPYPPTHGGAVRMWNMLKALASRCSVDVLSFAEPHLQPAEVTASVDQMKPYCGRVRVITRKPVGVPVGLLDRTIHYDMFDCREMRETLLDMIGDGNYDIIQFHKTEMGQYLLPKPAPAQVLVEHIIFHHAYRRQFISWRNLRPALLVEYLKLRHHELDWCSKADAVLTMSGVDADFLHRKMPSHPWILEGPNGVDTKHYHFNPTPPQNHDLLFVGNFDHSPNVDGVRFFLREVYPSLKASLPDVRLFIVGPGRYDTLEEVASELSAIPTGLVEDTRTYMERCSVFIAPILAGSGTRVKILEAMAAGIPVVSTTIGAEGINVGQDEQLLLADDSKTFAVSVTRLLQDRDLCERLRKNARTLVETKYSWQVIGSRLESIYRELLQAHNTITFSD